MNRLLFVLIGLFGLLASGANGQNHVKGSLYARAKGSEVQLAVQLEVERGWHVYHGPTVADMGAEGVVGVPTRIELEDGAITWGDWRFPEPEGETQDFGKPLTIYVHRGTLVIWRRGVLADGAKLDALRAKVTGDTCENEEGGTCVPFTLELARKGDGDDALFAKFPSDLSATSQPKPAVPAVSETPSTAAGTASTQPRAAADSAGDDEEEVGREKSLWQFLLSAVVWGLVTLLMPCTYPMIPITISYFTKQASTRKSSTLPLSLFYGFGIVLSFIVIGLVAGPVIIPFASHWVTNLFLGAMFLFFALSLFGLFTIQPPAFLLNVAGSASQKGGYLGVFLMGATLVVTSFTCTAPFVGTLLATGATGGDASFVRIALGMGVFGLTMAIPFVFLSLVPQRAKSMPKSGEWMHVLKVFLGFVEIAAALKFISNADLVLSWNWLSRELFLVLWFGIFLTAALHLFGLLRLRDEFGQEEAATITPRRMVGGLATFLFALYCLLGAFGQPLDRAMTAIVPNYSGRSIGAPVLGDARGGEAAVGHVIVKDDFDAALVRARKENKLLLANFTGVT